MFLCLGGVLSTLEMEKNQGNQSEWIVFKPHSEHWLLFGVKCPIESGHTVQVIFQTNRQTIHFDMNHDMLYRHDYAP